MRVLLGVLILSLVLVLAACGGSAGPTATSPQASPGTATATATASGGGSPTSAPGGSPVAMPEPVRLAIEVAARDAGVPVEAVVLIGWSQEDFESSALGCPRQDMAYLPVITPGYIVHLSIDGREVEYHTNLDTTVVRCPPTP